MWLRIVLFQVIVIGWCFAAQAQTDNTDVTIWDELNLSQIKEKNLTQADLEAIFSRIDYFDYVRTNEQKIEILQYLLEQCQAKGYNLGTARCKNMLGVIYRDQSKYSEAIAMHESALNLAGADTLTIVYSLNNLGVVYRRLDKPRLALDFHMRALHIAERMHDMPIVRKKSMCVALNSIGNINLSMEQPAKAIEVFQRSLEMEKSENNRLGVAINLQNIGGAYEMMSKLDTALYFYQHSLLYNEQINSIVGRSICNNSIGNIYLKKAEPIRALEYFHRAMVFSELTHDAYYISQTHANIGKVYLSINQPEKAIVQIRKYNEIASNINSGMLIKESHLMLSEYYELVGDYKSALKNYRKAIAVNDSILNEKNTRYLNELQVIYEAQKKEQHIDLLMVENRIKSQQILIVLVFSIFVVVVISILIFYQQRKNKFKNIELEQKLFRSQMNPHFIFNALGSIQSFMYKNEPIRAANYLGQFSQLTRSILKNSAHELITLEDELETLNNYVDIEKMRMRDSFEFHCEIDPEIEVDFTYVPPIMLQPFIENAIHHGLRNIAGNSGIITLRIIQNEHHIHIEIIDNGMGINASHGATSNSNHKSLGLAIFKERMRLIEKKYKKTVNFAMLDMSETNPTQTGTKIIIDFPLIYPND